MHESAHTSCKIITKLEKVENGKKIHFKNLNLKVLWKETKCLKQYKNLPKQFHAFLEVFSILHVKEQLFLLLKKDL